MRGIKPGTTHDGVHDYRPVVWKPIFTRYVPVI